MRARLSHLLILCVSWGPLAAASALAETVHDDKLAYRFELPAGYRKSAEGLGQPYERRAFLRGELRVGSYAALSVAGLGGTIGRKPMNRELVERAARAAAKRSGVEPTRFDYGKARFLPSLPAPRSQRGTRVSYVASPGHAGASPGFSVWMPGTSHAPLQPAMSG